MTVDLTNLNDANWKAKGRKELFRRIDRGEADLTEYNEEYLAELRQLYPDYAEDEDAKDADANTGARGGDGR